MKAVQYIPIMYWLAEEYYNLFFDQVFNSCSFIRLAIISRIINFLQKVLLERRRIDFFVVSTCQRDMGVRIFE